jgi:hypothetical protein
MVVDGWDATNAGLASTALAWSGPVAGTLLIDQDWFGLSLSGLMGAHLTQKAIGGLPRARLVVSGSGVAVLRRRGRPRFTRWHLFDEARLEPTGRSDGERSADATWILVLVNAYKPSISTYLHRRGTDAAIFAPCVEFALRMPASRAEALRRELSRRIADARRDYRALQLKRMDEVPLDTASLLGLQACLRCGGDVSVPRAGPRCPACGERFDPAAFVVHDAVLAPAWLGPLVAFLALLAAPALLIAGLAGAAAAAACLGLAAAAFSARRRPAPTVVIGHDAVELWHSGEPKTRLRFAELATLGVRRLATGRWRVAAWREPRGWTGYSEMLFCWLALPPGRPALDLLVRGDPRVGELLCREIERRWRAAV